MSSREDWADACCVAHREVKQRSTAYADMFPECPFSSRILVQFCERCAADGEPCWTAFDTDEQVQWDYYADPLLLALNVCECLVQIAGAAIASPPKSRSRWALN